MAIGANKPGPTDVNEHTFFENGNMLDDTFLAMPMGLVQAPVAMWARTDCRRTGNMDVVIALPIR